jgi:hypothetical protein
MPGTARPRSAGCRSRRRATLGPSNLPRFAGCSRSPAPTQRPGSLELLWGFPRRTRNGRSNALTPHRRQAVVLLRTSTWEMGAIAMYVPREMVWLRCRDVSTTSSTAQSSSVSKSRCPPSSAGCCAAAPGRLELERAGSRARGRDANALRGLPRLRLTKLSGAILHNRGAVMFPAETFEEWPR